MQLRLLLMIPKWHKDIFHNFSSQRAISEFGDRN